MKFESTKIIELGSCAFRQWRASSHCKFIHGYRLIAKFWFACKNLDEKNWVVDFGGLKDLKQALEKQFDHTLCISKDDPLLNEFINLHKLGAVDLRVMEKGVGIERTAEWCFEVADSHIRGLTNNRCWVEKVEVWEHEKNSALVSYNSTELLQPTQHTACDVSATNQTNAINVVNAGMNIDTQSSSLHNTTPLGSQIEHTPLKKDILPAPVKNKVTSGYSNLFAGTSWGK